MANTNLIYTYIQDSGYKLQYVASVLHISSNTLRHKLLGETQFKLDEAERLSTMLGLTMAERDACFFDAENRFSASKKQASRSAIVRPSMVESRSASSSLNWVSPSSLCRRVLLLMCSTLATYCSL